MVAEINQMTIAKVYDDFRFRVSSDATVHAPNLLGAVKLIFWEYYWLTLTIMVCDDTLLFTENEIGFEPMIKKQSSSTMNVSIENVTQIESEFGVENALLDRDENLAKIEIATLAIIFLVTVLGNGTVLLALWTRRRFAGRKKLSRMYFFILHLSIADLITAFLSVLPQLGWEVTYRFNGGVVLCKLIKFGQTLGPYLSSYILMATAIDRHQAICYPLTYCSWTSRRSKVMVWLAWGASLTFCIPQSHSVLYKKDLDASYKIKLDVQDAAGSSVNDDEMKRLNEISKAIGEPEYWD
ncbi:hypothetical protein FQA39_LY09315 [Lamprigera yunnana]|nr:hypothetical protein FQA39_LY09315 [Lamprigera yunnana]